MRFFFKTTTVILPTCNRPEFLRRALCSIASTFKEVRVVDDASSGAYHKKVVAICREFPEVHLLRNDLRIGAAASRNRGAKEALGKWLLFLDDDDYLIEPLDSKLQAIVERFPYVAAWVPDVVGGVSRKLGPVSFKDAEFRNQVGGCSGLLIKRSLFVELRGFDVEFESMQDWDFWLRLIAHGNLHYSGQSLVVYNKCSANKITHDLRSKYLGLRRLYFKHRGLWSPVVCKAHLMRLRALRLLLSPKCVIMRKWLCILFREPITLVYYFKWLKYRAPEGGVGY